MPLPDTISCQIKISESQMGLLLLEFFCQWGHMDPKTLQAIAITLGYPLELDSKILLLKILHSWVIEHREIKLILTWKLHPFWLAFMVLEGAMNAIKGEKQLSYPTVNPMSYSKEQPGKMFIGSIVVHILWGSNIFWLYLRSIPHNGTHAWHS